jgi:hypothetical protein
VSGAHLLTRELWIAWQRGPRADVTIDAIRLRPPFNAEFYRQFLRGTYDQEGAPFANLRWMEPPHIYVRTVDQNNRPIEPEVLAVVREALARGVSEFSAGRFSAAAVESGADARPDTLGWIKVNIVRDRSTNICGRAQVGANPGTITLYHDVCSCGSNKIPAELVLHEIGHAMGFFHVPDRGSVMHPTDPVACGPSRLSPAERFHAGIAYSRPRGNRDPDIDPPSGAFLEPSAGITVEDSRIAR